MGGGGGRGGGGDYVGKASFSILQRHFMSNGRGHLLLILHMLYFDCMSIIMLIWS